jgi:hypothetical protein
MLQQLPCCAVPCSWSPVIVLQDSDSAGQKLGGALLNAIIFMAVIGGMTFVLFLLFKWGVSALLLTLSAVAWEHCWHLLLGKLFVQSCMWGPMFNASHTAASCVLKCVLCSAVSSCGPRMSVSVLCCVVLLLIICSTTRSFTATWALPCSTSSSS